VQADGEIEIAVAIEVAGQRPAHVQRVGETVAGEFKMAGKIGPRIDDLNLVGLFPVSLSAPTSNTSDSSPYLVPF